MLKRIDDYTLQRRVIIKLHEKIREIGYVMGFESLKLDVVGGVPDAIVTCKSKAQITIDTAEIPHVAAIFEVKSKPRYESVGQLLRYKKVYGHTYLVIPSNTNIPTMFEDIIKEYGIGLILFDGETFKLKIEALRELSKEHVLSEMTLWHALFKLATLIEQYTISEEKYERMHEILLHNIKREKDYELQLSKMHEELRQLVLHLKPSLEIFAHAIMVTDQPRPGVLKFHDIEYFDRSLLEILKDITTNTYISKYVDILRKCLDENHVIWPLIPSGLRNYLELRFGTLVYKGRTQNIIKSIIRKLESLKEI